MDDDAERVLSRMRETLAMLLNDADRLSDSLLAAKLTEVIDMVDRQVALRLR